LPELRLALIFLVAVATACGSAAPNFAGKGSPVTSADIDQNTGLMEAKILAVKTDGPWLTVTVDKGTAHGALVHGFVPGVASRSWTSRSGRWGRTSADKGRVSTWRARGVGLALTLAVGGQFVISTRKSLDPTKKMMDVYVDDVNIVTAVPHGYRKLSHASVPPVVFESPDGAVRIALMYSPERSLGGVKRLRARDAACAGYGGLRRAYIDGYISVFGSCGDGRTMFEMVIRPSVGRGRRMAAVVVVRQAQLDLAEKILSKLRTSAIGLRSGTQGLASRDPSAARRAQTRTNVKAKSDVAPLAKKALYRGQYSRSKGTSSRVRSAAPSNGCADSVLSCFVGTCVNHRCSNSAWKSLASAAHVIKTLSQRRRPYYRKVLARMPSGIRSTAEWALVSAQLNVFLRNRSKSSLNTYERALRTAANGRSSRYSSGLLRGAKEVAGMTPNSGARTSRRGRSSKKNDYNERQRKHAEKLHREHMRREHNRRHKEWMKRNQR